MATEFAPAKVNLTLTIHGRRPDGYHELSSLVAFAACGDELTVVPGENFEVSCQGPFARAIDGDNLVARAVTRARAVEPRLIAGAFRLTKSLPVAAGLGGGSADAAATLRLLRRLNPDLEAGVDWPAIATSLGADVPVCLDPRAAHMAGLGERVTSLESLPRTWAVLANPGVPLSTAAVFGALGAPALSEGQARDLAPLPANFGEIDALIAFLRPRGNDMETTARRLCPAIGAVMDGLATLPGVLLTRLSGSGPTSFGLFASDDEARRGATQLAARHPNWWVVATELR
jgi:4-diphosphocytidyl-2-C-methyl-D-erythritol kinase